MRWNSVLTCSGVGAFLGFTIAVWFYSRGDESLVYIIYAGMLAGALLGVRYPVETKASAYAFPLGFFSTSLLAGLWTVKDVEPSDLYAFLALVVVALIIAGPSGFLDMFLVPLSYFGGFAVAMLAFKGYQPLQGTEGAVMGLFMVGVMGSILGFFAVLGRWAFGAAKKLPRR